jgi:hypothetical protein
MRAIVTELSPRQSQAAELVAKGLTSKEISGQLDIRLGQPGTVPFFATAAMPVAYRRNRPHWWEYLEVIEKALEDVAPLTEEAVPALILLARRNRALKETATT